MKARYLLVLILSLLLSPVVAQNARQLVRQGNKQFRLGNAAESEVSYRKAVEKDARNPQANYNLGNALMLQRKDSLAITQFEKAAKQGVKFFIIDNITFICNGTESGAKASLFMKQLIRLKKRYGLTTIVIAHTPKRRGWKPITQNDLAGSSKLINFFKN